MPISEYCETINKSDFSNTLKKEGQALSKKGDPKLSPLALYQPVFCKRRSSCTTDERNIAADFDRNVYSWSLLSIRAHQLVNRLSLSALPEGGKSEGGESFLLFLKSYSLVSIDLHLPLEKRPASPVWTSQIREMIFLPAQCRVWFDQTKLEKDTAARSTKTRRWISRWCKWLELMTWRGWFLRCIVTFRRLERRIYRENVLCKGEWWMNG